MTRKELDEYGKGDEFMEKLSKDLEKLEADNEWFMNPEKDHQMILNTEKMISFDEGVEQGVAQAKKEAAINMINKNLDLKTISECTGLSLEELKKLEAGIKEAN